MNRLRSAGAVLAAALLAAAVPSAASRPRGAAGSAAGRARSVPPAAPAVAPAHIRPLFRGLHRRRPGGPVRRVRRQVPDPGVHPDAGARLLHRRLERRLRHPDRVLHLRQGDRRDAGARRRRRAVLRRLRRGPRRRGDRRQLHRREQDRRRLRAASITTYNVTRLDFDVEDLSQTNPVGIDRRNKAIALVEQWAARHHRTVQFVYTIGTNMTGLDVPTARASCRTPCGTTRASTSSIS